MARTSRLFAIAAVSGGIIASAGAAMIEWRAAVSPLGAKLFSFSTMVSIDDLSRPGGRIFRAVSSDKRFACAAHFVYSVSSRMVTNSNQVEFFCREADRAPQINFERIESLDSREVSKSNITFFDGRVVDLNNFVSISPANKTKSLARQDGFRNGRVYYLSRKKDGTYLFFSQGHEVGGATCPGMSISDEDGNYYGSITMSSYVSYFDERALFDLNGALYVTDALEKRPDCSMLHTTQVKDGVGWPYGGIRTGDGFLIGGSGFPAHLYEVKPDLTVRTIGIDAPPAFVSEIYSYLPLRNRVLVGTFPSGHPFSVASDGRSSAVKTDYFPLRELHWKYPESGAPYRELQAMANSYGILWGGMYPWGEVIANDRLSNSFNSYRLFSHPTLSRHKERLTSPKLPGRFRISGLDASMKCRNLLRPDIPFLRATNCRESWGCFEMLGGSAFSRSLFEAVQSARRQGVWPRRLMSLRSTRI